LLRKRAGAQQFTQIDAMEACNQMAEADGITEQAATIDIARKHRDATATQRTTPFPIVAGFDVEVRLEEAPIGSDIRFRVRFTEEPVEGLPCRQLTHGRQLEAIKSHV